MSNNNIQESSMLTSENSSRIMEPSLQVGVELARFSLRVQAILIDGLIIGIMLEGLKFTFENIIDSLYWTKFEILIFFGVLVMMASLTSSRYQGTVGKILLNMKVTDLQGKRISFIRALARYGIYYISYLIPIGVACTAVSVVDLLPLTLTYQLSFLKNLSGILTNAVMVIMFLPIIGLFMIAFTRHKQALHDKLFKTLVVKCNKK